MLCPSSPLLCHDTFVTMNLLADDGGAIHAAPDLAMDGADLLRLKPQNLLVNLPLAGAT